MLQGSNEYNLLVLGLYVLLLGCVFIINKNKVRLPQYYILAILIYLFYLIIGVFNNHENPFIDIKFQLFGFIFFFCLINIRLDIIKLLFFLNTLVFIIYVLLFLDLLPNIWHTTTVGFGGRVYGPSIIAINLILFYYIFNKKTIDFKLVMALLLGVFYVALTTNFMNLAVLGGLLFLLVVNFRKLMRPVYIISILVLFVAFISFLNSPFVPELVSAKMKYVYQPWDYPSLKTRVDDFNQIVSKENFGIFKQIFGEGFGTSSQIYRYNPIAVSLSRTLSFQEIDNGFYYIYHRGGWTLFTIFILSHVYLVLRLDEIKARLAFIWLIFVTCILSIHYFNYSFYLLLPFFILYGDQLKKISEK